MIIQHDNDYDLNNIEANLDESQSSKERLEADVNRSRILIFLQDTKTRKDFIECLNLKPEFVFHVSHDLSACVTAAAAEFYDILITDFCDFDSNVGASLTKIREDRNGLAAVFLTKQDNPLKEIEWLNLGVDSVVSGAVKMPLIIARIKAVTRWRNVGGHSSSEIGPFAFDIVTKTLSSTEFEDITVTNKEARILKFLLSRKGMIVSRTDMLLHVWGYNSTADTHTVETHIYRLRKKIGRVVDSKTIITTEVGGYRLVK